MLAREEYARLMEIDERMYEKDFCREKQDLVDLQKISCPY